MKEYVFYSILFSTIPILVLYLVNINGLPMSLLFLIILIPTLILIRFMLLFSNTIKIHRSGIDGYTLMFWFFKCIPFQV
jgi:hypothetical protein